MLRACKPGDHRSRLLRTHRDRDGLRRYLDHPNLYRVHGQVANQNFYGGPNLDAAIETLRTEDIEIVEHTPDERQAWVDAVQPLEARFIDENEALGLPARAFVREAKERAAVYADWTDEQLWDHTRRHPFQGVIDL